MTGCGGVRENSVGERGGEERCGPGSTAPPAYITPGWPLPSRVRALVTTRSGGTSQGVYGCAGRLGGGLNLGAHCGDDPLAVRHNRAVLAACLPSAPVWLDQVHGTNVIEIDSAWAPDSSPPVADAALTRVPGRVLAVLSADCLPVLFADEQARVVAVAHAGWRGLASGVIENTVAEMRSRLPDHAVIVAWLGPAIGREAFEVGAEVRDAFCAVQVEAERAFRPSYRPDKWLADLEALARLRLASLGVSRVGGGGLCTHSDPDRFYSYRRDGVTGRLASLIWLAS